MTFDRTNTFTLGRNQRREKDTHPEYTGSLNINGVEYWLSAWVKDGKDGKFFSGRVKPKQPFEQPVQEPIPDKSAHFDDEIPF